MIKGQGFPNLERWVFRDENKKYRFFLMLSCSIVAVYYYSKYHLFIASLFFFLLLYLMGTFKGRKKIDLLLNEDPVSVALKITSLINTARNEIKILSGSINPKVYCHPDVINAFDKALQRGVEVFLITNWEQAEKNHKEIEGGNSIINWAQDNRLKIFDFGEEAQKSNHFIVVDKKSFRVEGMHDLKSDNRKAVTAYNNKRAKNFLDFFDDLIKNNKVTMIFPTPNFTLEHFTQRR